MDGFPFFLIRSPAHSFHRVLRLPYYNGVAAAAIDHKRRSLNITGFAFLSHRFDLPDPGNVFH